MSEVWKPLALLCLAAYRSAMGIPLTVVLLEDHAPDAELIVRELRRAGWEPKSKRVTTEEDFVTALDDLPDVILADSSMPVFNMSRAVALLRELGLDIPVIAVCGARQDEMAAECIRLGAADFVSKDDLSLLRKAIERAIAKKPE